MDINIYIILYNNVRSYNYNKFYEQYASLLCNIECFENILNRIVTNYYSLIIKTSGT